MPITRSQLGRGPAYVTFGGAELFTRDDLVPRHSPVWEPVNCSLHGQIDKFKKDFTVKLGLNLFGLWSNLTVLFPSYLMNPAVGTAIFGATDNALVILARDGSRITYANAQITKLAELYLGVDSELFAASVEITALLKNNANPEDAGAYFTRDTATYSETTFSTSAFKKTRWSGAWTGITGFTSFAPQKGARVSWNCDVKPDMVDGYGTVGMYIGPAGMIAGLKCVPIGPTMAQIDTAQAAGVAHGALLSAAAATLTLTGSSGGSVALTGAALTETGAAFGIEPLRVGEVAWETTRSITTGTAAAVAAVS